MKFSEFANSKQAKPEGVVIDGTFGCQHCRDSADEAEYFPGEKILKWTCQDGHVSFIEEFSL